MVDGSFHSQEVAVDRSHLLEAIESRSSIYCHILCKRRTDAAITGAGMAGAAHENQTEFVAPGSGSPGSNVASLRLPIKYVRAFQMHAAGEEIVGPCEEICLESEAAAGKVRGRHL